MTITKLHDKPETYAEESGEKITTIKKEKNEVILEVAEDEKIVVLFQSRFPDYDFIFGIPHETNKHFEKEVAFYQFRDTRKKEIKQGFYLDRQELEDIVKGFWLVKEASKIMRPDVWKEKVKVIYEK